MFFLRISQTRRTEPRRFWSRLILIATSSFCAIAPAVARVQEAAEPPIAQPAPPGPKISAATLDQWAFGQGGDAPAARTSLEKLLTLHVEHIERTCAISEAQKKKLELAGRGDIKRFFDDVDAQKRKLPLAQNDADAVNKLAEDLQNLRNTRMEGAFDEGSFFAKALPRILSPEQAARYRASLRESRAFVHRAQVALIVELFDMAAALRDEERQRLEKLLLQEVRPLKRSVPIAAGFEVVAAQAVNLPEAKLRPVFSPEQWRAVNRLLNELKSGIDVDLDALALESDEAVLAVCREPAVRPAQAAAQADKNNRK
jgi:hypothetical protein